MTENRHVAQPDSARLNTRTKLTDSFHRQKSATGGATNKRTLALAQQPPHLLNQSAAAQTPGAEKDPKKMAKVEIPVSLDIDPFSTTDSFTSPSTTMNEMLLAKEGKADTRARPDDVASPESRKPAATPSPLMSEAEAAALRARVKKVEMESATLRHALLETKTELKAAEERLREKDTIIKDQEERINDLIDTRVPMDDMNDVMAENERLQKELKESEAMLAECQKVLEEYAAADEDL
ncbi:hypothetical protein GGI00_002004 [Coemansia sp. RSA 2681]|nr:hypothetical protein GGI00_002004 [Coemansia sp. RSA 2681]